MLFGLDRLGPVAQLVALRPHIVVATFAIGCVAALASLPKPRRWPVAAGLLAISVAAASTIAPRAIPDLAPQPASGRTLTVLSFNTYEGRADLAALTELIHWEHPDLVSLPEAGDRFRARLAPLVTPLGYQLWSSTPADVADVDGVTALARGGLRGLQVRLDYQTERPSVELSGGDLGSMRFVAFHAAAPVNGGAPRWRADLDRLPYWCAGPTPAIVAGDVNATLDHSVFREAMRGCTDAAATRGDGLIPTWSWRRSLRPFAIQIDHVLATPGIRAQSFRVLDLPGSDHRAILTRLLVPG